MRQRSNRNSGCVPVFWIFRIIVTVEVFAVTSTIVGLGAKRVVSSATKPPANVMDDEDQTAIYRRPTVSQKEQRQFPVWGPVAARRESNPSDSDKDSQLATRGRRP